MSKAPPLSMADLARLAGVSESTVSRALNDNPLINAKTRARIQSLAREHNYKINESARNLRLQRSHTISVLINNGKTGNQRFSDPFMIDLIGAIADRLAEHRYDLLFAGSRVASQNWHDYLLGARRADGIIVIGQGTDDNALRELQARGDPLVVWGNQQPDTPYCTVGSDNTQGGRLACEHLIHQGRQDIVFLGDIGHPEIRARFDGYLSALEAAGLATHERHIGAAFSTESGQQCVQALLAEGPLSFDAIFAASDNIAMGAINALRAAGYRVPEQVAVVGFDDIPIAPHFAPPLTTVRQDIHRGGQLLVDKVMALVKGRKAESEILPTQLIARASSGAAAD